MEQLITAPGSWRQLGSGDWPAVQVQICTKQW